MPLIYAIDIGSGQSDIIFSMIFFRSDQSEKSRKELENRCNFYDERIDAVEREVMTAKRTTMDACEKYEETSEKVNRKEKALAK